MTDSVRSSRSLPTRLSINFMLMTLLTAIAVTGGILLTVQEQYRDQLRQHLQQLAAVAALQIDPTVHGRLQERNQEFNDDYNAIRGVLQKILAANPKLRFVYTMRASPDSTIRFVVDAADPSELAHLGAEYETPGPVLRREAATLTNPTAEDNFYTDEWGTFLTGYAPIFRADGGVEGIIGLDISADIVTAQERAVLWTLGLAALAILPFALWLGRASAQRLTRPIVELAKGAQQLADGHLEHRVDIRATSLEIDTLSRAFNTMAEKLQDAQQDLQQRIDERTADLQRTHRLVQAIVDNAVEAILAVDGRGLVRTFNPAAEKLFGNAAAEIIGRPLSVLLPSLNTEPDAAVNWLQTHSARNPPQRREIDGQHRDGRQIPLEVSVGAVDFGGSALFVCIFYDVSERRRVDRLKDEFIATVSHELRTPLTSIRGSLGLLRAGTLGEMPEKMRELVQIAEDNAVHLGTLIDDLLDVEKLELGKLELTLAPLAIAPLIEKAIHANEGYAARFDAEVLLWNEVPGTTRVLADDARLLQVMHNLLSNAIKFSPPHSRVDVHLTQKHGLVRVEVRDQGPGITEDFRGRIFQKFAQADSSAQRRSGGTGLGLSICKAIVDKLGGRIGYESLPGEGATFFFELPEYHGA